MILMTIKLAVRKPITTHSLITTLTYGMMRRRVNTNEIVKKVRQIRKNDVDDKKVKHVEKRGDEIMEFMEDWNNSWNKVVNMTAGDVMLRIKGTTLEKRSW